MFLEIEIHGHVSISKEYLDTNGVIPQSLILTGLLKELLLIKSTERHGYYIAITKLKSIGNGELEDETREIIFPVSFSCRTFLPVKGEVMFGVVYKVHRLGVFLRCGPMNLIYLSSQKMPNFHYVRLKTRGMFLRDDMSRIQDDVVVRFMVFAVRWGKARSGIEREGEFTLLASLEGDCLGPVSLCDGDEMDLMVMI